MKPNGNVWALWREGRRQVDISREFVNYHHPGPRGVWKVGSQLQSTTLDPLDPVDPVVSKTRVSFEAVLKNLPGRTPHGIWRQSEALGSSRTP